MKKFIVLTLVIIGLTIAGWAGLFKTDGSNSAALVETPETAGEMSHTVEFQNMDSEKMEGKTLPEPVPSRPTLETPTPHPPKAYRFGSAETVLTNKLALELGRDVTYSVNRDNRVEPWRLICGAPTETDGTPLDYENSKLKADYLDGFVNDRFCALFKTSNGRQELVAFDLGSTDNYMAGWVEKLNLPEALTQ